MVSRTALAVAAIMGLGLMAAALLISNSSLQGPSELLKAKGRRVVPKKSELKRGPSGVPYWGTETVRVDKALSKKLHHKTVTEILRDGLQVTDIMAGKGPAAASGDVVKVHYVGKLAKTGKKFDAGTISFKLGAGKVIKGWDQGLQGLHQGGTRMLHIPPALAYGAKGTPGGPIPGEATLLFSVKMLHVNKHANTKGVKHPVQAFKKKHALRKRRVWTRREEAGKRERAQAAHMARIRAQKQHKLKESLKRLI